MKKVKRIDAITRCKGAIADVLNRKSARINRQVEQAIDMAKDKSQDALEAADEVMNSFGEAAGSQQTSALSERINKYKDKVAEAREWAEVAAILEELKGRLQEEVEVEEEEEKK